MTSGANPRGDDVNIRAAAQMCEYVLAADRIAAEVRGTVLDWGCGQGQMTSLLRERGLDTDAFDYRPGLPSPEREPLEHYPAVEALLSSEPIALPFPDGQFDAVLSMGVLEHVMDPAASLRELHRVLRPGGRLYVYKLPNRFSYLEWIARRAGLYYHGQAEFDRLYTLRSAKALVADGGFAVDEARLANMLPLTVTHPLAQRFARAIWRVNRALGRVPGLNALATNVEVIAHRG